MEILFFLILFSVGISMFASSKGRNPVVWFFISMVISPLISFVVLLIIGEGGKTVPEKQYGVSPSKQQPSPYKEFKPQETITADEFVLSLLSIKKLHDKKILSDLEYKTKKNQLIKSLKTKKIAEEKDDFLVGIVPLLDEGILDEEDMIMVKMTISY